MAGMQGVGAAESMLTLEDQRAVAGVPTNAYRSRSLLSPR